MPHNPYFFYISYHCNQFRVYIYQSRQVLLAHLFQSLIVRLLHFLIETVYNRFYLFHGMFLRIILSLFKSLLKQCFLKYSYWVWTYPLYEKI